MGTPTRQQESQMHKLKALSLALVASMLAPATSRADDAAVRKQIESQMARFQQAFRKKDIAALRAITTSDFTMKTMDGAVSSRREAEAAMVTEMNAISSITKWTLKINKITVKGNVATLIVTEEMTATVSGGAAGSREKVSYVKMRETWVKTRDGWRYKRAEALEAKSGPKGMSFVAMDQLDTRKPDYVAARKAIERQYAAFQRAVRNKDYRGVLATMDPAVTVDYPNKQTFNRKQIEFALLQQMAATRSISAWELKIVRLTVTGDTAVASIGERMVSVYADSRGKLHNRTLVDFYQDTWVKSAKGWRLKNTLVSKGTETVDGHSSDPFN
jgi:ketosteroid isomerase-like protein